MMLVLAVAPSSKLVTESRLPRTKTNYCIGTSVKLVLALPLKKMLEDVKSLQTLTILRGCLRDLDFSRPPSAKISTAIVGHVL